MGLFVKFLALSLLTFTFSFCEQSFESNRILYLIQSNNNDIAWDIYDQYYKKLGQHDSDLLLQMTLALLDQGYRSSDEEIQLLTIYGAGISTHESTLYILEDGITSKEPKLQLVSLNFLSRFQNDEADELMNKALASPYLIIRLEALYSLALKKTKKVVPQIDSLMLKVPKELVPIFPQLYAAAGTPQAILAMKKLLTDSDEKVRVEAILSSAKAGRDDLLPLIRSISSQHGVTQQEACSYAFLKFKDEESISKLENFANSSNPSLAMAAARTLYSFGKKEFLIPIEKKAKEGNLFAITLLGEMGQKKELLYELCKNKDAQIKFNAAFALLKVKDGRSLPYLCDFLIRDSKDLAFLEVSSKGGALSYYKVIPSAQQNFQENPVGLEISLSLKEEIIAEALKLPEKDFLKFSHTLLLAQQNDLIPVVIHALENLKSKAAIGLLKKHLQSAGAPLVRNYCNLALYRLKEDGPYKENLKAWILNSHQENLIFRPLVPWEMRQEPSSYELLPQETSRLLIESFESLIQARDDAAIDVLIEAIKKGNQKNKYALAGLLIRACQ